MSISPPHKKLRTEPDVEMIPTSDAPVNALFVPPTEAVASTSKPQPKQGKKKNRKPRRNLPEPYSPADVTFRDVRDFLGEEYVEGVLAKGDESEWHAPEELELWSMIELEVGAFTVSGMLILVK
jgi:tRNA (uracil-5-)-methyltransferase